jgi:hypothetical protein
MSGLQNVWSSNLVEIRRFCCSNVCRQSDVCVLFSIFEGFLPYITIIASNNTFYFKKECKLGKSYTFCLLSISNLKTKHAEAFISMDVLKLNVLKPDVHLFFHHNFVTLSHGVIWPDKSVVQIGEIWKMHTVYNVQQPARTRQF